MNQLANTVKSNPLIGNKILLAKKSILSNIVPFQNTKEERLLNDKIVNIPIDQINSPIKMAAVDRLICLFSISQTTEGSNRLIAEVKAANEIKAKNKAPNRIPPFI
jgi:hypothetical protein